jgi:hypothetical protein
MGLAPVGRVVVVVTVGSREGCGQELGDLESKGPVEWMAARAGGSPLEPSDAPPSEEQTSKMLVARMGWETREGIRFTVGEYSVRLGTALQHDQVRQRRAEAHVRGKCSGAGPKLAGGG